MYKRQLSDNDHEVIGALFHVVNDVERVGDHSENIAEQAQVIIEGRASLSSDAIEELHMMENMVYSVLDDSFKMFLTGSANLEPVSYTHLDVYKRQGLGRYGPEKC